MAYGSPQTPEDIEPYYTHIRGGKKPLSFELEDLRRRYSAIGGLSPLVKITNLTASRLETRMRTNGCDLRVHAGMKHSNPFVAEVLANLVSEGTTELLAVALAPHYSKIGIGGYQEAVRHANKDLGNMMEVQFVDQWCFDSVFIGKWVQRIRKALAGNFQKEEKVFFLFTAHSLPERILSWNDPYRDQLLESSTRIASVIGLESDEFGFSFQSASDTSEPWLGPDILDEIKKLAREGRKNILVVPIGFVSDHLEILFDIDIEARNLARKLGTRIERTESFNDSEDFIDILESVVKNSGFLAS